MALSEVVEKTVSRDGECVRVSWISCRMLKVEVHQDGWAGSLTKYLHVTQCLWYGRTQIGRKLNNIGTIFNKIIRGWTERARNRDQRRQIVKEAKAHPGL
jgi:hypothetical protein